jgi:alanine racemase
MRSTRVIISLDILRANVRAVRERVGPRPLICFPVKADGYGFGAIRVSRAALSAGAQYLAVATVTEGIELRQASIPAPIFVFSIPTLCEIPALIEADLIPFVSDREFIAELARVAASAGKRIQVHLKIDTGMGRIGCTPDSAAALAALIAASPALEYAGTATHFAVADSFAEEDIRYTKCQISCFKKALDSIREAGVNPGIVSAANSGAVVLHEDAFFDMVRPGILLYGYPVKPPTDWGSPAAIELVQAIKPFAEWVTQIAFVKKVPAGQAISYGCLWRAPRETNIATLTLGYADGLRRDLAGKMSVWIQGKAFPLVGRICMDQCMVDVGENEFERGTKVTIMGGDAPHAGDIAALVGTIPYEITCGINKRVVRDYINEE